RSRPAATRSNATSSASASSASRSPSKRTGATTMAQPKDFGFGSEEQMLRDSARKFLKDNAPIEKLRALVAKDHKLAYESDVQPLAWDEKIWKSMVELGWTALAVPESAGGAGMKMIAVAALAEEIGR